MNTHTLALTFTLIGALIGAAIGKSTFDFVESITWMMITEDNFRNFFDEEFWTSTAALKLCGGGLIGGLCGYGLHTIIQKNKA